MRQRISRNSKNIHVTMHRGVKEKLKKYAKRNNITMALALEKILSLFFHADAQRRRSPTKLSGDGSLK